jgi:DEAD/DEAH box helicase
MTLAELQKHLRQQNELFEFNAEYENTDPILRNFIEDCKSISIPFWRWNLTIEEHLRLQKETGRNCCITCKLGWPLKNGKEYPLFPYQHVWYDYVSSSSKEVQDIERQHPERKGRLLINKATGIGCTEYFLRMAIWQSIVNNKWRNSRCCIVTGPRLDLAVTLIQRIKNLFQRSNAIAEQYGSNPRFDSRETVVYIGSTKIEAFPSNNQQSLRGLTNVKLLLIDEFAFFQRHDQQLETKTIMERMHTKEGTLIVAISTPGTLMNNVMFEMLNDETTPYHKISMDYTVALKAGLYTPEEIEIAKRSPSCQREFMLTWLSGAQGSFLQPQTINDILNNSKDYDPDDPMIWNNDFGDSIPTFAGMDLGYGSTSNSAITVIQVLQDGDIIRVVHSAEYKQYTTYDIVAELNTLMRKYKVWNCFIDASSPETIRQAKSELHWLRDSVDYENELNRHRKLPSYDNILKNSGKVEAELSVRTKMVLVPVNFGLAAKWLSSHARMLCSVTPPIIQVSPKLEELVNAIQSAVIDDTQKYIKSSSNYSDVFDSWRLALCGVGLKS